MRLQRVLVRKGKEKDFHKWQVTLPPEAIEALGWGAGDELVTAVDDGRLVISRQD